MQSLKNLKKQVMIPIIYSVLLFSSFIIYYKYANTFLSETFNSFSGKVGSTLDGNGDLKVIGFSYICLVIYSVLSVLHVSWRSLVSLKHASYTTYISDIKYITLYFGLSLVFVNLFNNYNEYSKLDALHARTSDKLKIKHDLSMKTSSGPDKETQSTRASPSMAILEIINSLQNVKVYQRNSYLQCLLNVVLLAGFVVIYTTCYFMQREKYKEEEEEEKEEEEKCIMKDLEKQGYMYSDSDSDCED